MPRTDQMTSPARNLSGARKQLQVPIFSLLCNAPLCSAVPHTERSQGPPLGPCINPPTPGALRQGDRDWIYPKKGGLTRLWVQQPTHLVTTLLFTKPQAAALTLQSFSKGLVDQGESSSKTLETGHLSQHSCRATRTTPSGGSAWKTKG